MRVRRFSCLRERLLRAGIAPRWASRLEQEWSMHRQDLVSAAMRRGLEPAAAAGEADALLGDDEALFAQAMARPELLSRSRRRPALLFGLAPLLFLAMLLVGCIAVWVLAISELKSWVRPEAFRATGWLTATQGWFGLLKWAVPASVAALSAWWAFRHRAPVIWPLTGMLLVALLGASINLEVQWSAAAGIASLTGGLGFSTARWLALLGRMTPALLVMGMYRWAWHRTMARD